MPCCLLSQAYMKATQWKVFALSNYWFVCLLGLLHKPGFNSQSPRQMDRVHACMANSELGTCGIFWLFKNRKYQFFLNLNPSQIDLIKMQKYHFSLLK